MGDTTKITVVLGVTQAVLIALALLAAGTLATYWLAVILTTGSFAAIGLNLYYNLDAPYGASKFVFASFVFTALLLFGFAVCWVWADGGLNRTPVINVDADTELPIDPKFMSYGDPDRHINAPTLLDMTPHDVKSHRRG